MPTPTTRQRDPLLNQPIPSSTTPTTDRHQTSSNRPAERTLDRAERERLVLQNMRMVEAIARRIHARLPRSVDLQDLVHEGMVGLIEAIDRYDEYRSVPLRMFARQRITGAILDMLRNLDWVPRTVRRRAELIDDTREQLRLNLGRAPNRDEMAKTLNVNVDQYDRLVRNAEIRKIASLDAPANPQTTTPLIETIPVEDDVAEGCRMDELRAAVLEAVDRLPPKERAAVRGFYLEERPLVEVGNSLGVSESRASQLHRMGVTRLRYKVREHLDG